MGYISRRRRVKYQPDRVRTRPRRGQRVFHMADPTNLDPGAEHGVMLKRIGGPIKFTEKFPSVDPVLPPGSTRDRNTVGQRPEFSRPGGFRELMG
jgi:hypothetical protein